MGTRTEEGSKQAAAAAKLHFVAEDEPGYRRLPWGGGFTYLDPQGERVQDRDLRRRFAQLAIPPAWTDVWISTSPRGHIQATGRDQKGRKQYIYHPEWEDARNRTKFDRLLPFGRALPALRERVDCDLSLHGLRRRKVLALLVRLLEETLVRVGNPEYARANRSYGLTTLRKRHFDVHGAVVVFSFRGKRGSRQHVEVHDRRLANKIRQIEELPGQLLFQYRDDEGDVHNVDSGDVNAYLRELAGDDFSAKDFRTWGATCLAIAELHAIRRPENARTRARRVREAVRRVAESLRNTPAVCRNYYIHPAVLEAFEDGTLAAVVQEAAEEFEPSRFGLGLHEQAIMVLLRREQRARSAEPRGVAHAPASLA